MNKPLQSQNACPDRYRDLSPKRHCELRSVRLGHEERPGGLPQNRPEVYHATDAEAREIIVDAVARGVTSTGRLREAARVDWDRMKPILAGLVMEGRIRAVKKSNRFYYLPVTE